MQSAYDIAWNIQRGIGSPVTAVDDCLARIDAVDDRIRAWVHVDREGALSTAHRQVEAVARGQATGPLFGVPVALKDVYDAAGMPTRLGAPAFAHHVADRDSPAVARLRAAGAIILGKTETTQFEFLDPAPTRNPWDLARTPGGSSSGSAAAVAAGMAPLALGSQTVGSTLRPAAYCGIVGLKPSHGRISAAGVFPLAPSYDHVGIICRGVRDAALALSVLAGADASDPEAYNPPVDDYLAAVRSDRRPPRLGLARAYYEGVADDEVSRHLSAVAQGLAKAGADVREVALPLGAQAIADLGQPVLRAESASVHADRYAQHKDEYGRHIGALVQAGLETGALDYIRALNASRALRQGLVAALQGIDALLLPVAPTTAPDISSTGAGIFCAPASFTGLPAIALPSGLATDGLPLSVQLIAAPFAESRLLSVAAWVEPVLDFQAEPPIATS